MNGITFFSVLYWIAITPKYNHAGVQLKQNTSVHPEPVEGWPKYTSGKTVSSTNMESEREEEYVSLRLAHGDIENVLRLLNLAKAEKNPALKAVIVRYCIIEYAKPFKMSRGVFKKKFKPIDTASVFPSGNLDHEKLITERDQRIAHGDITAFNPKLHYWSELDTFPIVQRSSHLCDKIAPLIEKMEVLCDIVNRWLVDSLTAMETEFRDEIKKGKPA